MPRERLLDFSSSDNSELPYASIKMFSVLCLSSLLLLGLANGDNGPSPPYKHFYEFSLPIPPTKVPLT
jgi:hypothetical protein